MHQRRSGARLSPDRTDLCRPPDQPLTRLKAFPAQMWPGSNLVRFFDVVCPSRLPPSMKEQMDVKNYRGLIGSTLGSTFMARATGRTGLTLRAELLVPVESPAGVLGVTSLALTDSPVLGASVFCPETLKPL